MLPERARGERRIGPLEVVSSIDVVHMSFSLFDFSPFAMIFVPDADGLFRKRTSSISAEGSGDGVEDDKGKWDLGLRVDI